jgi:hypothetical protein
MLLQHLKNLARQQESAGQGARAALDLEAARAALHHPDLHRNTIYEDLRNIPKIVDDERVCWYESGDPGPGGNNARVILDLEATDTDVDLDGLGGRSR